MGDDAVDVDADADAHYADDADAADDAAYAGTDDADANADNVADADADAVDADAADNDGDDGDDDNHDENDGDNDNDDNDDDDDDNDDKDDDDDDTDDVLRMRLKICTSTIMQQTIGAIYREALDLCKEQIHNSRWLSIAGLVAGCSLWHLASDGLSTSAAGASASCFIFALWRLLCCGS